jgi:hypothetical protein
VKTDGDAGKKITQQATVYTDDPRNAKILLVLTGEVLAPADITPKAARLIGPAGSTIQTDIIITPPAINPFEITDVKAEDGKNIALDLKKSNPDTPHFILRVVNTQKNPGRYSDKITLKTTSPISPELVVRVFGMIREN